MIQYSRRVLRLAALTLGLAPAGFNDGRADDLDIAVRYSQALEEARLFPRTALINRHIVTTARLSPNGRHLAFLTGNAKRTKLWLQEVASGEIRLLFTSDHMRTVYWTSNSRHLVLDTAKGIAATPIDGAATPAYIATLNRARGDVFHGIDTRQPSHILVSRYDTQAKEFRLVRLDMDGTETLLHAGKSVLHKFTTGSDGQIKFFNRADGLMQTIVLRNGEIDKSLLTCRYDEGCAVLRYNEHSQQAYLLARQGHDLQGLFKLDMVTGDLELLHRDPNAQFDVSDVAFDAVGDPMLVSYNTDYREIYGIGPDMSAHVKRINSTLKSRNLYIYPDAASVWLVIDSDLSRPDNHFYLYFPETGEITRPLQSFKANNAVKEQPVTAAESAIKTAFWYKASDGYDVQGYVTFPRGKDISEAPLIAMPHGGPWNRSTGNFNSFGQFLANRGYIVFEPNFRSSTGFGRDYVLSAQRDYGDGRVQQDIIDGIEYLLAKGIGHKDRLGIFGHSFGGFSAMAGLTFTPELFQVGIAGAPPPDLSKAFKHYAKKQERTNAGVLRSEVMADLAVDISNPKDIARLYDQSPDRHVSAVIRPLYIIAGRRDRRVSILDVRDYAIRLEETGAPVFLMVDPKEGHGFRSALSQEAYFFVLETALADHLEGGRFDPEISAQLRRYLARNIVMGKQNALGLN